MIFKEGPLTAQIPDRVHFMNRVGNANLRVSIEPLQIMGGTRGVAFVPVKVKEDSTIVVIGDGSTTTQCIAASGHFTGINESAGTPVTVDAPTHDPAADAWVTLLITNGPPQGVYIPQVHLEDFARMLTNATKAIAKALENQPQVPGWVALVEERLQAKHYSRAAFEKCMISP